MKTTLPSAKTALTLAAVVFATLSNAQTASLEFASGAGNPTANGPSVAAQAITFQKNSNNPTGTSFTSFSPALTATFSLSNQQYSLPSSQISTARGLSFGANLNGSGTSATSSELFDQMNAISSPSNSHFTSLQGISSGTGIAVGTNRAVSLFTSARALYNAGASTSGRFYFADLTVTFNRAVTNPVVHIIGLGGYYSSLGFTTELELQTSGVVLSKISGSSELSVSTGTKILNSASEPSSNTGAGGASGSVLASGSSISSLVFRVYMRGDGDMPTWGSSSMHAGDVWMIGVSLNVPVQISGRVYNDKDGMEDGLIDGAGIGSIHGAQLYANLLNVSNKVLASQPVPPSGMYTFSDVASNTDYRIQVNTVQGAKGQDAPAVSLPAGWVNTAEFVGAGAGSDGSANGLVNVSVDDADVTNINFGLEKTPVSDSKFFGIGTPAINSYTYLVDLLGLLPGPLSGTDEEDGLLGLGKKVAITSLPTGGNQLWYNGTQVTKGVDGVNAPSVSNPYIINNYLISVLGVRFTGLGSSQTSFTYAYYDEANKMSATPATYTLSWATILPVKLISFTAMLNNNKVDLKWTTATEVNASHFVVERSLDGVNFNGAGIVFAAGNSAEKTDYSFTDNGINTNQNAVVYYRLCTVDKDGGFELSETKIVRLGKENSNVISILAYPNPVTTELRVTIPASWQGKKVSFDILSNNGSVVRRAETSSGSQTETINVSNLVRGFYVVRAVCNNETAQQKIIKQ